MQFPSNDGIPPLFLVVRGDRETWHILFLQYNEHLYRFIAFLGIHEEEDIRDIAADTWTKAWEAKSNAKSDFRSWLFKIAKNTTIDVFRKRNRRGEHMSLEPEDDALPDGMWHADPEDLEEQVEIYITFLDAWVKTCAQISKKEKKCYILFTKLKTPEEIAEIMGLERKVVEAYIRRARKILLEEYRRLKGD